MSECKRQWDELKRGELQHARAGQKTWGKRGEGETAVQLLPATRDPRVLYCVPIGHALAGWRHAAAALKVVTNSSKNVILTDIRMV